MQETHYFLAKYVICVLHFTPATNSGAGKTHGFPQFPPIRIDKLGLESSMAVTPQLSCEDEPRADQNMYVVFFGGSFIDGVAAHKTYWCLVGNDGMIHNH